MVTAAPPSNAAAQAQAAITNFLRVAPKKYTSIIGTVASGSAGGGTANVVWQSSQPPIVPAFCTGIDYEITMPITLTLGATTGSATLSPFAPYSGWANQIQLAGAPPWPLTELTPWYLDWITHSRDFDPQFPGLGNNAQYFSSILDQGPSANQIGGSGSLNPGATVTNSTGSPTNTNYSFLFKLRQNLQRKRQLLWGAIPFGDPENRPNNIVQLLPTIGINPEQTLFVNTAGTGTAAVLNGAATVNAIYELAYIDLLPPGMTSVPQPTVNFALQLIPFSVTNLQAGTLQPITHRTAQLYTAIHHVLVNGELPIRADYFGLWDDQDQQSARWAFDAQVNTFPEYFNQLQRRLHRYLNTGHYMVDMESGGFPDLPTVSPLDELMSPDASYAAAFGLPVTPAMTTTLRIPSATSISNAYVRIYSFGMVRVPY